jgi:hypothetical protein
MKILPFAPKHAVDPVRPEAGRRVRNEVTDFNSLLGESSGAGAGRANKVAMENRLARLLPPLEDVGAARGLLSDLQDRMRQAGPETLGRLHNLDGILYYFQI